MTRLYVEEQSFLYHIATEWWKINKISMILIKVNNQQ